MQDDEDRPATRAPAEADQPNACREHRRQRPLRLVTEACLYLIALAQVVPDTYREQLVELVLHLLGAR